MKRLIEVTRDTEHGVSVYLRYRVTPVVRTKTMNEPGTVMVDFDAANEPIGIELIDPNTDDLELLARITRELDLSLGGIFAYT